MAETYPKTSETYPNDHLLPGVIRQSQSSVSAVSLGRQAPQLRGFTALAKKCSLGKPPSAAVPFAILILGHF